MTIASHLQELRRKHETLSEMVEREQRSPAADAFKIAELKKPLAKATVPDNQEAKTELGKADPVAAAVKTQFFKDMTPIQRAAYDRAMKAKAAAK